MMSFDDEILAIYRRKLKHLAELEVKQQKLPLREQERRIDYLRGMVMGLRRAIATIDKHGQQSLF